MDAFIKEIFVILTTPPGNLAYHLVLAFSAAGALLMAANQQRRAPGPQANRLVFGLSLILALRLLLFILAGLAWQGLVNDHLLIPPVDRGVTLVGLVLAAWLWVLPEPVKLADAATILLGLLAITLFVLGLVWWSAQDPAVFYNASRPDQLTDIAALLVVVLGVVLLVLRRPDNWGAGLGMLLVSGLGHGAALTLPYPTGDYPALVRLAQLAAYPLLLALPGRLASYLPTERFPAAARSAEPGAGDQDSLLEQFLQLAGEHDPARACQAGTRLVANALLADICLMATPPGNDGSMTLHSGYDLISQQPIAGTALQSRQAPLLASAVERGLSLRLPDNTSAADLKSLAYCLGLSHAGHLLSSPIYHSERGILFSLVLLTPYSNHPWSDADQARLNTLAAALAQLLHHSLSFEQSQQALARASQESEGQHSQMAAVSSELEQVQARLHESQAQLERYKQQAESLAALVTAAEAGEHRQPPPGEGALPSRLRQAAEAAQAIPETSNSELRLALEEVARLQTVLADAEQKYQLLKSQSNGSSRDVEMSVETSALVQELRQPMSAIMGYTDFLLGESVGILGALQRKFLERVKMSTERMNRLVEDLGRLTAPGAETARSLTGSMVDLYEIVDEAVAQAREQMQKHRIHLRIDLPEGLPALLVEREALIQSLAHLLDNASRVTPENQEISLRARVEGQEYQQRYILLQVSDRGCGVPPEYMPRVFSRFSLGEGKPIPGIAANSTNLPIVKALVEKMGGRIWIDSQPDNGATFSVLLPLSEQFELDELADGGLPG